MTLLVFGAGGQVGRVLLEQAPAGTVGVTHAECDICDEAAVRRAVLQACPSVVINCAAYTAVDKAESERERAFAVNEDGAGIVAKAAAERGLPILHISTDYVYPGTGTDAYVETDAIAPPNTYGASKAAGDAAVQAANSAHILLRVSWVFGTYGGNFVKTMLRLGSDRPALRIVDDQVGGPTEAGDIAAALLTIASACRGPGFDAWGAYHFCGAPPTTWFEFAREIFERAKGPRPKLTPISSAEYPTPARRPLNSRLDCTKISRQFAINQPDWRASLSRVLQTLKSEAS